MNFVEAIHAVEQFTPIIDGFGEYMDDDHLEPKRALFHYEAKINRMLTLKSLHFPTAHHQIACIAEHAKNLCLISNRLIRLKRLKSIPQDHERDKYKQVCLDLGLAIKDALNYLIADSVGLTKDNFDVYD